MNDKQKDNNDNKQRNRIIALIIILIIIILLLITCCTSSKFGRIGDLFTSHGSFIVDKDSCDLDVIYNQDLKFDTDNLTMSLSDENGKITYHYENINPDKLTCTTSDASIATCYVKDGYVVINPKSVGEVKVILETTTNGMKYRTTATVTIKEANRYIVLNSYKGTIYLNENKVKLVGYSLVRLKGKLKVTSSDPDVATATIVDGVLKITGKKAGTAKITVSLTYDGKEYTQTYTVNVVDKRNDGNTNKNSDSKLKDLNVNSGNLHFNPDVYNYAITVPYDTDKFTMDAIPKSDKSKVKYKFNGEVVDSLEDLELKPGDNKVEIVVEAEDGSKTVYTVTVTREDKKSSSSGNPKSHDNSLKSLEVSKGNLSPDFNKDVLDYSVTVPYDTDSLDIIPKISDSKSKVKYKFNGEVVDSLEDLELKPGDNKVEIVVEAEDGSTRTYTVNVHRKKRTVIIDESSYTVNLGSESFTVTYKVYEDGVEITDYDLDDIEVYLENFDGTYEIHDGYIVLKPNASMKDKKSKLTLKYGEEENSANLEFVEEDFYLEAEASRYNVNLKYDAESETHIGKRKVVLNNNILSGKVRKEKINGGIRLYDQNNPDNYIDITSEDGLNIEYVEGNSSLVVEVEIEEEGSYNLNVKGHTKDDDNIEVNITLKATEKFIFRIEANGGFFDEFTTYYEYLVESSSTYNLNNYVPYKEDDTGNCLYYEIDSYNTKEDGTGTKYNLDSVISNLEDNLTLYAIYKETSNKIEVTENKKLYLAEVDLFHNEEYFQEYGEDKVIYPGAHGSYVMNFTNNYGDVIKITGMTLEEDTICLDDGCINMGYVIKYAPNSSKNTNYYYGSKNGYSILYQDADEKVSTNKERNNTHTKKDIVFSEPIIIKKDEAIEMSLLWEWPFESGNDKLDTLIGNEAFNLKDLYELTVSINFEVTNSHCSKDGN